MHNTSFFDDLKKFSRLIARLARDCGLDYDDDIKQEAALQLLEARRDFNEKRGIRFQTYFINGKLWPALLRLRAAQRFGIEIDAARDGEVVLAQCTEDSIDSLLPRLTDGEEEALDAIRDTHTLARQRGVSLRRAQQIVNDGFPHLHASSGTPRGARPAWTGDLKMGRQRTIDDANFWRHPVLANLTQEDKATLLYLLTSPFSNIIGCYSLVPRIAAAEMGWSEDQFLQVISRLSKRESKSDASFEFLRFDRPTGYIWVKTWWSHNSAKGAFSSKIGVKAKEQLAEIPNEWLEEYLTSLAAAGIDTLSIGYQSPIDRSAGNTNSNPNLINITTTNKETSVPGVQTSSGGAFDVFLNAAGRPEFLGRMGSSLKIELGTATDEQARWAGIAWRATVARSEVESPDGLAVGLCQRAAAGEMTKPRGLKEKEKKQEADDYAEKWARLKALAGKKYSTPEGPAKINPNGTIMVDWGSMSGTAALEALSKIESMAWRPCGTPE